MKNNVCKKNIINIHQLGFPINLEIIIPIKFVFAYTLINGSYSKEVVREVIIHEYLHYYCDLSTNKSKQQIILTCHLHY